MVAIDIDDLAASIPFFNDNGVDIVTMLKADPVQIVSGRPNRAKILYRLPDGLTLPTFQHTSPDGQMVVELRCADQSGEKTMMDVLTPSTHPDTGQPYSWKGDWRNITKIPEPLLRFWQSIVQPAKPKLSAGSARPYLEEMESIPRSLSDLAEAPASRYNTVAPIVKNRNHNVRQVQSDKSRHSLSATPLVTGLASRETSGPFCSGYC